MNNHLVIIEISKGHSHIENRDKDHMISMISLIDIKKINTIKMIDIVKMIDIINKIEMMINTKNNKDHKKHRANPKPKQKPCASKTSHLS